jgi:phenylalanyl-tRNA synthetase beta chain
MIGLGFNEVTTFTISNEKDEFTQLGLDIGKRIEIQNPIGEEYSCLRVSLLPSLLKILNENRHHPLPQHLRVSLLPSLLKILNENRHHPLPQQIFELGAVVDAAAKNRQNLAAMKIDAKANFTECKSLVEAIMRDSGVKYNIKDKSHPAFIAGRCASVIKNNKEIGLFGEVHPKTITAFELDHPIIAFEIQADTLYQ